MFKELGRAIENKKRNSESTVRDENYNIWDEKTLDRISGWHDITS